MASIKYLEEERVKVEKGILTEEKAFFVALDNENALIESRNLTLFSTGSPELKHFLNFLLEETQKHIKMIKNKIEETKK